MESETWFYICDRCHTSDNLNVWIKVRATSGGKSWPEQWCWQCAINTVAGPFPIMKVQSYTFGPWQAWDASDLNTVQWQEITYMIWVE